ncbi:DnaJ domain protein [Parvimonas sp. oral taxon 393 str. F0440]|nr:DnaJ domain protein [Parvimonas sp. oral taxon 393 str. F0440]
MRDLYEILGVEKNCSKAELKSAYRKLAKNIIRMLILIIKKQKKILKK